MLIENGFCNMCPRGQRQHAMKGSPGRAENGFCDSCLCIHSAHIHSCAVLCVLSFVCFHVYALICVLSYMCSFKLSALIFMLSHECSQTCVLGMCAFMCPLSEVCCHMCFFPCVLGDLCLLIFCTSTLLGVSSRYNDLSLLKAHEFLSMCGRCGGECIA